MPYIVVPGTQPLVPVTFVEYRRPERRRRAGPAGRLSDSRAGRTQPGWIEGGAPGNVDARAAIATCCIVDRDNRILYELYARTGTPANRWEAGSGAIFPLTTQPAPARRRGRAPTPPGLAILPGLVRYDEAFGTEPIRHAFRVTVRATNGYVYPGLAPRRQHQPARCRWARACG